MRLLCTWTVKRRRIQIQKTPGPWISPERRPAQWCFYTLSIGQLFCTLYRYMNTFVPNLERRDDFGPYQSRLRITGSKLWNTRFQLYDFRLTQWLPSASSCHISIDSSLYSPHHPVKEHSLAPFSVYVCNSTTPSSSVQPLLTRSIAPLTRWYLTPGQSWLLPPLTNTTECCCTLWPSPGI